MMCDRNTKSFKYSNCERNDILLQYVCPECLEKSTYMALYIAFCQVWNCARYTMLPEYYPSEEEKTNPKLFADNVRRGIADEIKADITGKEVGL